MLVACRETFLMHATNETWRTVELGQQLPPLPKTHQRVPIRSPRPLQARSRPRSRCHLAPGHAQHPLPGDPLTRQKSTHILDIRAVNLELGLRVRLVRLGDLSNRDWAQGRGAALARRVRVSVRARVTWELHDQPHLSSGAVLASSLRAASESAACVACWKAVSLGIAAATRRSSLMFVCCWGKVSGGRESGEGSDARRARLTRQADDTHA